MKPLLQVLGIITDLLILLLIVIACSAPQSPRPDTSSAAASPPPVISMTIAELKREYDANQVAADKKFKGKWMQISDTRIDNITPSAITFSADNDLFDFWSLRYKPERGDDSVLFVSRGETVTLLGLNGGMSLGSVDFNQCTFMRAEMLMPTPTLEPPTPRVAMPSAPTATPTATLTPTATPTSMPPAVSSLCLTLKQVFALYDKGEISLEEAKTLLKDPCPFTEPGGEK